MAKKSRRRVKEGLLEEWPRSSNGITRISLEVYYGNVLFNVRRWARNRSGILHPTRRGETIPVEHLPRLLAAVKRACARARKAGLLPEDAE